MKTLFILRHAKSSWDNPILADFERPLNERGLKSARLIGEIIRKKALRIDLMLSSPANRAKQTALDVRKSAVLDCEIKYEDRIYEASPQTLQQIVSAVAEKYQSVMIVGHNPGIEGLIRLLTGEILPMPTAATAIIDLEIANWHELEENCGVLRELLRARDQVKTEIPG